MENAKRFDLIRMRDLFGPGQYRRLSYKKIDRKIRAAKSKLTMDGNVQYFLKILGSYYGSNCSNFRQFISYYFR